MVAVQIARWTMDPNSLWKGFWDGSPSFTNSLDSHEISKLLLIGLRHRRNTNSPNSDAFVLGNKSTRHESEVLSP